MVINKIDSFGRAGWLAVTIVGFWFAWPIGFVVLAYLAASGRLSTWWNDLGPPGTWFALRGPSREGPFSSFHARPSGNQTFDDYREATIRGLEDEQREFQSFLERLRRARDKAEFDAFMAERRRCPGGTDDADPTTSV